MRNSIELMFNDVGLVVTGSYSPGDPGQTSGPPERCWPPEPASFDCDSICVVGSNVDIIELLDSTMLEAIIDKAMEKAADMLPVEEDGHED